MGDVTLGVYQLVLSLIGSLGLGLMGGIILLVMSLIACGILFLTCIIMTLMIFGTCVFCGCLDCLGGEKIRKKFRKWGWKLVKPKKPPMV